ncbi:MAG: hypothetical protein ACI80V_002950 [Rhodothermales bacterium]|jgi:hypothetical protein
MFSSVEVEQRPEVIEKCYWPLLRMADRLGIPIGVEAPGLTLEIIRDIDPAWIAELRRLMSFGLVEFIGSGYSQIIGPLVPAAVNRANFRIGHEVYEEVLGSRPAIALVNEQAFSGGLVPLYLEAGYEAVIMEWNNPAQANPQWDSEWLYQPQRAAGTGGTSIPIIWNESIAFQKFQRYLHGELEEDEYLEWFDRVSVPGRFMPVYGGDAEIFGFRPGRFATEPRLSGESEWGKMEALLGALEGRFVAPSAVLEAATERVLTLGTAAQPVPVKKQGKYNLMRWAVTGRDDFRINGACWGLAEALGSEAGASDGDWRELCYLWSSDFRTHITESRWAAFGETLAAMQSRFPAVHRGAAEFGEDHAFEIKRVGRFLEVRGEGVKARFNCRRGLALDGLGLGSDSARCVIVGTLPHGHFPEMALGADFYSGHTVLEQPGKHKITDLNPVEPSVVVEKGAVTVSGIIPFGDGEVEKSWTVYGDGSLRLDVVIRPGPDAGLGVLRLGYFTLIPDAFDRESMCVSASQGGVDLEQLPIGSESFDHGAPVSGLVSAVAGVGSGALNLGDARRQIRIVVDAALQSLVSFRPSVLGFLCRVAFTAAEIDDTRKFGGRGEIRASIRLDPKGAPASPA